MGTWTIFSSVEKVEFFFNILLVLMIFEVPSCRVAFGIPLPKFLFHCLLSRSDVHGEVAIFSLYVPNVPNSSLDAVV